MSRRDVALMMDRSNGPYNEGEIAGFPQDVAERLVKAKYAHAPSTGEVRDYERRLRGDREVPAALVPVRFLARWGLHNQGEVAGVPEKVAAALVTDGVAEHLEPPEPTAPAKAKAPAAPVEDKAELAPHVKKALGR